MEFKGFDTSFSLDGKTAIVTGGAAGIGNAVVKMFLKKGANVVIADMSPMTEDLAAQLGEKCVGISGDLLDVSVRDAAVKKAIDSFGGIDILVNSAGVVLLESAELLSEDYWDKTLDINLKASFLMTQCVGKKMIESQKGGAIVNMASQAGLIALDKHVAYSASKGGIIAMTKVIAYEWAKYDIRCNAVSPTVVLTDLGRKAWAGEVGENMKKQIPAKRFAMPEEIAASILFLASDAAAMITGENLVIDGGYTIK
ncbi:MAG TPA: D-threitol dehydrogenase [Ruminiclostridium sp.]